jgi:DNA-binding NtrC family response regulator
MASVHDDYSRSETRGGSPEAWLEEAVTRDPILGPVLPQLRRLAATDAPAMITAETGMGAELVARAIHDLSERAAQPFVMIDCASLSAPLIEAELLGVDGSPNEQPPHKLGIFEQAGGGTVLLAEIGELPPRLQEACMRLIERHEIVRLHSDDPVPANARILASTSMDLRPRIEAGLFRDDLNARLSGEKVAVQPLRERRDDIPAMAIRFLDQCCSQLGPRELAPEAESLLKTYPWPGNLRELRETIEDAAVRAPGGRIGREHLPERFGEEAEEGRPLASLRDVEMRHIMRVLQEARGNQRRASRILGISRWSLSRRLRKYGLQPKTEQ